MVQACNTSTPEAEAGGQQGQSQAGLQKEILSKEKKKKERKNKKGKEKWTDQKTQTNEKGKIKLPQLYYPEPTHGTQVYSAPRITK